MHAAQYRPAPPVDPLTMSTGADGAFYNCQNLANLRQDNLDTAAVVGQPVGMFFDKWVTNTLGADLVTNGTFTTNTTGWTAASATLSVVSAKMRVANSGAAAGRAHQLLTTVGGATYKVTIDLGANANGAAIAVGTSNSTSTLFLLTIASGTTGSYTFYFIATTTTSFIQLRTTSTTSGHFTEWDNVVCKNIAGRHLIQQTSTARPILRQDANGHYYLDADGIDDLLAGGLSATLQMPSYIAGIFRRKDPAGSTFGVQKNTTNYHKFNLQTSNRYAMLLRESTIGSVGISGDINTAPLERLIPCDSLAVVGTHDYNQNRRTPNTVANSWLVGTQVTGCAAAFWGNGPTSGGAGLDHVYAALWMSQDPGASRAGIRAYLANLAGAD